MTTADIHFEITETAAAQSPQIMRNNLKELTESGFHIAIDDFGTGHSNLYTLMNIPYSTIKLDRSLIIAMNESIQGRIGLESIVAMFKKLKTPMVAEGVETEQELKLLKELGVELIQGYYFSKPLSGKDFLSYIQNRKTPCT